MLAGASWIYVSIHDHGNAALPLAASLTVFFCVAIGLFYAAFGWSYGRLFSTANHIPAAIGFAALWVLFEWLRGWVLTGFPWLYLGHAFIDTPLAGWAPLTGVLGLSLIVALLAAACAAIASGRRLQQAIFAAVLVGVVAYGPSLNTINWTEPAADKPLRIGTVQANIPQHLKWQQEQYWPTVQTYRELTAQLWNDHDIVVWPEVAIPTTYQRAREFLDTMGDLSARKNADLITGVLYRNETPDGDRVTHNSVMNLRNGDLYHKRQLVPFGEYVPLESVLRGLIEFFDMPTSFIKAGPATQPLIRSGDILIGSAICYEIAYQDQVAASAVAANLLLTISNDAWFGASAGPHQHFQIARMRALETGKPLIRATGTGISGLIGHRGEVIATLPAFHQGVMRGELMPRSGSTPFARTGSRPLVLLCAVLILLTVWRGQSNSNSRRSAA